MARKKNNDNMKLAAISAVVSLFIVIVFFGGSLTGNVAYNVVVDVTAAAACTFTPSSGDLDFGSVSAVSTDSSTVAVTVENSGAVAVDVNSHVTTSVNTIFGSGNTGKMEMIAVLEGGSATNNHVTRANETNSAAAAIETLQPLASEDAVTLTYRLESGPEALTAASQSITGGLVVACVAS